MKRIWSANEGRRAGQRGAGQKSAPALHAQHLMVPSRLTGFDACGRALMMASDSASSRRQLMHDFAMGAAANLPSCQHRTWLAELVEQRPGVLQVGGIEALREPTVDRGEQVARRVVPTLPLPEASQAGRRTQLE